jgi:nucleotide-binding universal stress UspA family protein
MANTIRRLLDSKMDEAVKIAESAGLRATARIELGIPHEEILRVADEEKVSLIVCGRECKGFVGELLIGSITDRVVRYGNTPVYVPKCPEIYGSEMKTADAAYCRDPFRRILYPTDWSDCARNTLRYLKSFKEARVEEIVVAHVMDEKAMNLQPEDKFREFESKDLEKLAQVKEEL